MSADEPRRSRVETSGAAAEPIVYVVDDDELLRDALSSLFRSVGLEVVLFAKAAELMARDLPETPSCIVLDVRLPGTSGLDVQEQLVKGAIEIPVVFMTGHGDIPMSVRAMKSGAIDFLTKPFRDQDMLDAVYDALERDRARLERVRAERAVFSRYEALTEREKEVLALATRGLMNKQIAGELGLSEVTVKMHRGHMMRKMAVRTFADLVRVAARLPLRGSQE